MTAATLLLFLLGDRLLYPVDVAVDEKGVVFVADLEAHALFTIESGAARVVAQGKGLPRTPLFGIRHIAIDKEGRIVASDPATMKLYRIDRSGQVTPLPDDDRWVTPWGVAVEAGGAVLAVDRVSQRLRRVSLDGKVTDVAEVKAPRAVFFDAKGAICVLTDSSLLRVGSAGRTQAIVEKAPFQFPHDAAAHPNGNIYVSDGYAHALWQVTPDGKVTALVQGAPLQSPQGLAIDSKGNLLVADPKARTIFSVSLKGEVSSILR